MKSLKIKANKFAFDTCHKIYIIENDNQEKNALKLGYEIKPIKELINTYNNSCSLKFISYWDLRKNKIVKQFQKDLFKIELINN